MIQTLFDRSKAVLIIGGDFQGLGIARNLSGLGVTVIVVDPGICISKYSNHVHKFYKAPSLQSVEEFKKFLIKLREKDEIPKAVLFPTSDAAVYLLSRFRDELSRHYLIPTPQWDTIQYTYNKKHTYTLAEEIGIPVPKTYYPEHEDELPALNLEYPVILKPAVIANFIPAANIKAIKIDNRGDLIRKYRYMASIIDPSEIMVQELLIGGTKNLYSYCSFFRDGEAKARIMARRLRQHPMDFGTATTFAVTCRIPELEEYAVSFLRKIDYYGLSEVEFMFDERERTFKLIDINTRTWAWHTLGAEAGVNFSRHLFLDMHDEGTSVPSYETGVKWVREITDFTIGMTEILKHSLTVDDYLRSLKGKKVLAVFSAKDPLPFFVELLMTPYRFYKRGFRL
jgi:predicted ATP-grasp superfamily ATP-dependent carboligase